MTVIETTVIGKPSPFWNSPLKASALAWLDWCLASLWEHRLNGATRYLFIRSLT